MTALFLPFTPNGRKTELTAIEVKRQLGLGATASVDPFAVLSAIPARLIPPELFWERCPDLAVQLFKEQSHRWSGVGMGRSPDDGLHLILLNVGHVRTRQRATLMEEVVHIVLQHPMSEIFLDHDGRVQCRSHSRAVEDEAFNVGAACLIPYPDLFDAVYRSHEKAVSVAARFGVSEDYARYRIQRAGLFRIYRKHCGDAKWPSASLK